MPGDKYRSIQNVRMYRALRREGHSKESAARISNARTAGHTVKATRITGNLYRGEGGRFQAGTGGDTAKPTEDKPTVEQALEAKPGEKPNRAAEHDQWQAEEDARRQAEDEQIASEPNARKRAAMRRQVTAARQKRSMEQRARERENRATDRAQRETDRNARNLAKDQERAQREQAKLDAAANKPKKGGGGGGGGSAKPAKPSDDEKHQANLQKRAQTAQATAQQLNLPDGTVNTLIAARDQGGVADKRLESMGLLGSDGFTTDQGRRALGALERGDVGGYHAAIQDARTRLQREATARQRQADRDKRQAERDAETVKPDPKKRTSEAPVTDRREAVRLRRRQRRIDRQPITKAFRTYKDAKGADCWACITTSAYEDRDREIITRKGLAYATTYGQTTGNLGTLNYWHTPLVLGDCTFQALSDDGMFLIEAGTFRSKAAAELGRRLTAKGWRMSPGFLRPATEPYRAVIKGRVVGLYDHPQIFERSPCPPNRASNLYSPFIAKEATMTEEQYRVLKAIAPDLADTLLGQVQTQKTAAEQAGAVFKSTSDPTPQAESLPIYELDGALYTTKEGRLVALKAMAPAIGTAKADMPAPEMVEAGTTELDDGMADEGLETDSGLTLSDADIAAVAQAVIGLITPMFDIQKQIGELKSALGGAMGGMPSTKQVQPQMTSGYIQQQPVAQLPAATISTTQVPIPQPMVVEKQASAPDFNALLTQLSDLAATVKQLKGDQPEAAFSRPSQASDTVVQADNPLLAGYKSVADNPQGVVDSFLGGFPFPGFQQNGVKR